MHLRRRLSDLGENLDQAVFKNEDQLTEIRHLQRQARCLSAENTRLREAVTNIVFIAQEFGEER